MAFLIGQLLVPLALAAVFGGGVAGWSWHCIANRDRWAKRDAERARLRDELLSYVGYASPASDGALLLRGGEMEALQVRLDTAADTAASLQRQLELREEACAEHESRIAQLEMELASARAAMDSDDGAERFAAMEAALREAEAKAADVERRAAQLETALDAAPATPGVDVAAMSTRIRQLEAELAARDMDDSIARMPAPAPAPAPAPDLDDVLNRQRWQTRYLQARVRYLESLPAAPPPAPAALAAPPEPAPPVDEEAENRRRWRQRYLEARVAWLEGRVRDAVQMRASLMAELNARDERLRALEAAAAAPPPEDPRLAELSRHAAELEGALAAARADAAHAARRVAELEAGHARLEAHIADLESRPAPEPAPQPVADPEAGSLRWRSRYLDSRVRFLEQSIAATSRESPPPAAAREDAFAPLAPAGAEVRPAGMPAPRDGARDDLRLIVGIDPRVESTLNSLGVYHFDQIAAWTPANIDWVERYLAFRGRIGREDWVRQAQALARGEGAAGRRRYLEDETA